MIRWRCPCRKIIKRCTSNLSPVVENLKTLDEKRDLPIAAYKNLPKLEPIYSVDTGLTGEDYDSNGELKPLLPEEIVNDINSRWAVATPTFPYEPLPESTWEKYRRPETGPER